MPTYPTPIQELDTIVETLLSCLCDAVSGFPNPPANCCLRVGDQVAHDLDLFTDLCCEGLAYVSLGDIYPSVDGFPEADIIRQAQSKCFPPSWAVNLKMGIVRCVPVGTDTTMPTCAEWTDSAIQGIYDAQALAVAACCFRDIWVNDEQLGMSVVIGTNSTTAPEGGCIERFLTIQVQTPSCCS